MALLPTLGLCGIIVPAQASQAALRCCSSQAEPTALTALPQWPRSHFWPTSASAEQCWCWGGLAGTGEQHWFTVHQQPSMVLAFLVWDRPCKTNGLTALSCTSAFICFLLFFATWSLFHPGICRCIKPTLHFLLDIFRSSCLNFSA